MKTEFEPSAAAQNSFDPSRWMDTPSVKRKLFTELTIPSSHDSGAYDLSSGIMVQDSSVIQKVYEGLKYAQGIISNIPSGVMQTAISDWGKAQNLDILGQLKAGIRWLDLRTTIYQGVIYQYHGFIARPVSETLAQVKQFNDDFPSEIVALFFSHMNLLWHDQVNLATMIAETLGMERICATNADLTSKNISTLQAQGTRAIIFYEDAQAQALRSTYPWLLDRNDYFNHPFVEQSTDDGLISAYDALLAKGGSRPLSVGFTTTPSTADVGMSILNQFNPFSSKHDLHWFTQSSRDRLASWMDGHPLSRIGILSCDFIDEVDLLQICLLKMSKAYELPADAILLTNQDGNGLSIFDAAEQATPKLIQLTTGLSFLGMILINGIAYLTKQGGDGGIWTFDPRYPATPVMIETTTGLGFKEMVQVGNILYLTTQGAYGVWAFDLTTQAKPTMIEGSAGHEFQGICLMGTEIFLTSTASGNVWSFSQDYPSYPFPGSYYFGDAHLFGAIAVGNILYLTNLGGDGGIYKFNPYEPSSSSLILSTRGLGFLDMILRGDTLYLTAQGDSGIWSFDLITQERPIMIPSTAGLGFQGIIQGR